MRRRPIARAVVGAVVACLALSGCTAIPDSSSPQTVEPVRLDHGDGDESALPQKNASPQVIVSDFLDANAGPTDTSRNAAARAYLTPTARNQWSDQRVTIVRNLQIGNFDAAKSTIQVTGRVIGTINVNGIYQPTLQGTGQGGTPTPFPFTLRKIDGQYRIDQLRSGLLITTDQFRQTYAQHVVYYYDLSQKYLVPDVRWSAIPNTDSTQLSTWLVDQLVSSPRPELQDVVNTDTFPANVDPDRITVRSVGGAVRIEIPGSSQLESPVLNLLAQQLARTLGDVLAGSTIMITDGGAPVRIPVEQSTSFTSDSFPVTTGPVPAAAAPDVYYLNQGHIIDENGHPISGPLGTGTYFLTSFAVTRKTPTAPLSVAAVEGSGGTARLYVGTQTTGLAATSVHGALSRPAWAPGRPEIWIGDGSTIHLLTVSGRTAKDSTVQLSPTTGGGQIRSLRISPDGSQIAVVVQGSNSASGQLYVGAIVRGSGSVHISGLQPISPPGAVVTDADWISAQELTAVGYLKSPDDGSVFKVGVDGSFWTDRGMAGLPDAPVSITASNYGTWVEAGMQVWMQNSTGWSSPNPAGTPGVQPVYPS